ncbi:MAG: ADYC domain-containing protein [Myxococcota bacterium]
MSTSVSSEELTVVSNFTITGAPTSHVANFSSFTFDRWMFDRTNYPLNDNLDPVMGVGPNGPSVLGSSISGVAVDGRLLAGRQVIGSRFSAETTDGQSTEIRVDGLARGSGIDHDLVHYRVSYREGGGSWSPLCGTDAADRPVPAIALPGAWDLGKGPGRGGWVDREGFFLACSESSVAKCYSLGFKPWKVQREGDKVLSLHEACVRAIRADYLGTGESATRPGVEVVLATDLDDALAANYQLEAMWDVRGARCRVAERLPAEGGPASSSLPDCAYSDYHTDDPIIYSFFRPQQAPLQSLQPFVSQHNSSLRAFTPQVPPEDRMWLAGALTRRGPDVAQAVIGETTHSQVRYWMEEFPSHDGSHTQEHVPLIGVEWGPHRLGSLAAESMSIEVGTTPLRVNLRQHFETTPVILATRVGTAVPEARGFTIRVTRAGKYDFDIRLQAPPGSNAVIGPQKVNVLAVEGGETMVNGHRVLAKRSNVGSSWKKVSYPGSFGERPLIFATVATNREDEPVVVRTDNHALDGSIDVQLQEDTSAGSNPGHVVESVGILIVSE